jgi:hypothetical protein
VAAKALADTLAHCRGLLDEERGAASAFDVAVTNGRILLVTRWGRPLYMYRVDGVRDCPVCRESPAELVRGPRAADHEHLRAVVLVADGAQDKPSPPWQEVAEHSLVTVSHELQAEISPL